MFDTNHVWWSDKTECKSEQLLSGQNKMKGTSSYAKMTTELTLMTIVVILSHLADEIRI